jgi:transposase
MSSVFVGIDVAKAHLDVAIGSSQDVQRFANDTDGIAKLQMLLQSLSPTLVVLESTGGYEDELLGALVGAGLPVSRINPRFFRDFVRSLGKLAKTDRLDAKLLALYAERCRPRITKLASKELQALEALVVRRRQLQDLMTQEKNHLESTDDLDALTCINVVVECLKHQLKANGVAIGNALGSVPQCQEDATLLQSTPGVGPILTACLLSMVPELGTLNRKQIAALIGVAPMHQDSGTIQGKRFIAGGRPAVRAILYMAALSAVNANGPIRSFYARLMSKGKVAKVALVACMRKLLCTLNAMKRSKKPWALPTVEKAQLVTLRLGVGIARQRSPREGSRDIASPPSPRWLA